MTNPGAERVSFAFLERFWADREAGKECGLSEYLKLFPGHEEVVAREYLRALAEHRRAEVGDDVESSDENRLGPYRLIKELGRGGQGVVWLAEDTRLGRKVALKVLSGLGPGAEGHLARFRREAELASKLDHPGICGVHDTGIEGGVPYIALRYVEGETLAQKLARLGKSGDAAAAKSFMNLDDDGEDVPAETPKTSAKTSVDRAELNRTIVIFEQAANALHAAHEVGIIHRDIKPGNFMIAKSGQPVLLDFGLARDDSDDAGPSLTQTGDLFGTPAYMSPEQITGRRVKLDRRSDIYSLGVTLYECLTLKRPFEAPTRESLYQAIMSKEAQPARKLNRQIPGDLEVVLQCAMAKDRDKRYQTAADLAEDLRRVRSGEPILAKKVSMLGRAWRWSKRRPAAAALLSVLVLGTPTISGLGVWYWTHLDDVRAQERAQTLEAVEDQLEIGFYEVHHGDPKIAVAAFEKALTIDADTPEAVVGLAISYVRLKEPETALSVLSRSESTMSSPSALIPVKADVLRALGKTALADALLSEAQSADSALDWFVAGTRAMDRGRAFGEGSRESKAEFIEGEGFLHRAVLAGSRPRRAYHFALAIARGRIESEAGAVVADALVALWPEQAESWCWSGFATMDVDPLRSEAAYREAVRRRPGFTVARINLAAQLMKLGKHGRPDKLDEAVAIYRDVMRLKPGVALVHFGLGHVFLEQGKADEAVAELREAVRLKSDDVGVHGKLGNALFMQGKPDEAMTAWREAIALNPDDAEARVNMGSALVNSGRPAEGIIAFREAIRRNPNYAHAHFNLGQALSNGPALDEAIAAYREAIRLKPEYAEAHSRMGDMLQKQGKLHEAVAAYRKAIRLKPDYIPAHNNLGTAFETLGMLDEAVAAFRELTRLEPDSARAHFNLGTALRKRGMLIEAVTAYREAIRLEPDFALAHRGLGSSLGDQGKLDEANAALRESVRLKPDDAEAHYDLGVTFAEQGKPDDAVGAYREAIRLKPDYADAHCLLGVSLRDQGKRDEAIAALQEAVRLKPDHVNAHVNLGIVFDEQGKLDDAVAAYREAIRLKPDHVDAHINLGGAFLMQSRPIEAIAALREAIRLKPDDAVAHYNLGGTLLQQGKLDEAVAALREALRLDPGNQVTKGVLESALGPLLSEATRLQKEIKEDPEDAELRDELAWIFVDPAGNPTIHDPKRALPHARKAVELSRRRDAKILNTLAVALAANGEIREAIGVQEEILKLMDGKDVRGLKLADAEAALESYRKRLAAEDNQTRPSK